MNDTKISKPRGRPRRFDPDEAVTTAKHLFHARGFDALGVAEITAALGINPPSFYAAFGSKLGLYRRVLDQYNRTDAIPLPDLLQLDRPIGESLTAVMEDAARRYAADPEARGCLVIESTRCDDEEARNAARVFYAAAGQVIRSHIAQKFPDKADRLADFVCSSMAGLSAMARNGVSLARLLEIARLAGKAVELELHSSNG
jgi:TetR/AcrR family transcriptional repressor for divergent bdcA